MKASGNTGETMNTHLICLTIDTDPDGLSAQVTDRNSSTFKSLEALYSLPDKLNESLGMAVPLTWFIRIDNQIRHLFGTHLYLLEHYAGFWEKVSAMGHELAWHPHLYEQDGSGNFHLHSSIDGALTEFAEVLQSIRKHKPDLRSFRNGEAWHHPELFKLVEAAGFQNDATVIAGRIVPDNPLKHWEHAPQHPYYPAHDDLTRPGTKRQLLELPISTWITKASYDSSHKRRYFNPAIHPAIFQKAIADNRKFLLEQIHPLRVWNFISHPDDIINHDNPNDLLYSRSADAYIQNLKAFVDMLKEEDKEVIFCTVDRAATLWRKAYENH